MGVLPDISQVIAHLRKIYPSTIVGLFTGSMLIVIEGFESPQQLIGTGLLLLGTYIALYIVGMIIIGQLDHYSVQDRQGARDSIHILLDEKQELSEDVEELENELEEKEDKIAMLKDEKHDLEEKVENLEQDPN